ncbi:MAG: hypothetical protein QOE97_513 [Pseudonocardiales bacterium]|nr:hypothetical protein [Pseudonocardiales bacterium]
MDDQKDDGGRRDSDPPRKPAPLTRAEEIETLLAHAADIVIRYDRDLRHLFVNPAIETVAGLPPESFLGRTNRELGMPEELCALWERELGAVFDHGLERRFEFLFDGVDGIHWMEARVVPERNAAGKVVTILSVTRERTEARQAEQEIRESEGRYRELFERARDMIAVFDLDGLLVHVNPALERTLGYSAAELTGQPLTSILAEEEGLAAAERLATKRDGSTIASVFEAVMLGKDGSRIPIQASSEIVRRGSVAYGVMVIARDVREQIADREALEESEGRFRGAFNGVAVGMVIADPEARVIQANTAFANMLGYSASELVGRSIGDIVHPDDTASFAHDVERLRIGPGPRHLVADRRYIRKDGEILFAHVSVSSIAAEDGATRFFAAQIEDVTALRDAQVDLAESHALQQAVISVSPDVLAVLGLDGALRLVSHSAEEILGYAADEFVGRSFLEYVHPEDRLTTQKLVESALRGDRPSVLRSRVIAKDGSIRLWDGTVAPTLGPDGQPYAVVASLRDVTNQVLLEDQLRQAQKMEAMGQLAGGVAHDFNNLLTAIGGYAELALSKLDGVGGTDELEGVIEAAGKAAGLTAQLLTFSRRQLLNPQTFDLGEAVGEMGSLLRRLVPATTEIVTLLPSSPTPIHADRAQIDQVIMNLVVNAADAMPDGGRIEIEVNLDAIHDQARLLVVDGGAGMDAVTAARIFEPFFSTKGTDGTGLGLSIVHGIVSQSGGRIAVESELGKGTTFSITLPLTSLSKREPTPVIAAAGGSGETVLLVEDEPLVRAVLTQMLDRDGYQLITAATGEEALAIADTMPGTIDLLITDLILPAMNGRETADAIYTRQPQAKVLYMSGYTDEIAIQADAYNGGFAFIQKPFSGQDLSRCVRGLLDTRVLAELGAIAPVVGGTANDRPVVDGP